MTDLLFSEAAEDVEAVLVAWLTPLRRCSVKRVSGDELPFTLVKHVAGSESAGVGLADPIVSVHTLCDRGEGYAAAADEAQSTHRRMLLLARTLDWQITLADGTEVAVDYVTVVESPIWVPYTDEILRKVGRYQIGLTYTTQPDLPAGS